MIPFSFDRQLQASPEFKGIKTNSVGSTNFDATLQASPEFKGIKTGACTRSTMHDRRFKPALNSKGLRPRRMGKGAEPHASSQP